MSESRLASLVIATGVLLATSTIATAQDGRYTMTPTKDGILKLDTKTGAISLCQKSAQGWSCKGVEGEQGGLHSRIKRLEKENQQLRARLSAKDLAPAPDEGGKMEIPTEEDVDKAMDFMEKLLHRFKGMVEDLQKNKKQEEQGVPL